MKYTFHKEFLSKKHLKDIIVYLCFACLFIACASSDKKEHSNNLLDKSLSPYLREHADNPVAWHEWNDETLKEAKEQNKPLLISIGYAACHWCHVMEEESFMDTAVARIMNKNFICIKVDREERPDIDQIYINASEVLNGSAGWPLNAFALPDGKPFYAATYFPKAQWKILLEQVANAYREQPENVLKQASSLTEAIRKIEPVITTNNKLENTAGDYYQNLIHNFDLSNGGLNGSPKFPLPSNLEFLLAYHSITKDKQALQAATLTLDKIAMGGIYDHIGGGFARYSTDAKWKVPHFEKMLYDNAQLISVYAHAYQITQDELYADRIKNTIDFVAREMTSPEGAFYSSINADSEGEEGKFYIWTKEQIAKATTDAELFNEFYSIADSGNWENNQNILFQQVRLEDFAKRKLTAKENIDRLLNESRFKLFNERAKRVRPSTDTKIITSWNALMIIGLTQASDALENPKYLQAALKAGDFISTTMLHNNNELWHNYLEGQNSVKGFLDDYVITARAFICLYESTFDIQWLNRAKALAEHAIVNFKDSTTDLYYYSSDSTRALITRGKELSDQVIPSSNAVLADVLIRLGEYFQDEKYLEISDKMSQAISEQVQSQPFFSYWAQVALLKEHKLVEVAIVGQNAAELKKEIKTHFNPLAIFLGGNEENLPLLENKKIDNQTTIYICRNRICKRPVTKSTEALQLMTP